MYYKMLDYNLEVKQDKFFGFLTFKYKMDQAISPDRLKNLHYNWQNSNKMIGKGEHKKKNRD